MGWLWGTIIGAGRPGAEGVAAGGPDCGNKAEACHKYTVVVGELISVF